MEFKGETKYRSATGGMISIGTFMIFIFVMYMKVISHFGGDISSAGNRHLQAIIGRDDKADPFGWNWFSKNNFKFYSWINGDMDYNNYPAPVNIQKNGIDAINIYLINSDATRERDIHYLSAQIKQAEEKNSQGSFKDIYLPRIK